MATGAFQGAGGVIEDDVARRADAIRRFSQCAPASAMPPSAAKAAWTHGKLARDDLIAKPKRTDAVSSNSAGAGRR